MEIEAIGMKRLVRVGHARSARPTHDWLCSRDANGRELVLFPVITVTGRNNHSPFPKRTSELLASKSSVIVVL
jgi:hypothetical protein